MDRSPQNNDTLKYLIILILGALSCAACASAIEVPSSQTTTTQITTSPKIIFLNYAIKKNENGTKTVRFLSAKKVDGALKSQHEEEHANQFDGLICNQRDINSNVVARKLIDDPLQQTIEYIDDTKAFKTAQIVLDSSKFSVRLQLHPKTTTITIHPKTEQATLVSTKVSNL